MKTEPGISAQSAKKKVNVKMTLVKVEMHAPKRQSEKNALTNEKQIFIDKIVSLKSQNQQLLL